MSIITAVTAWIIMVLVRRHKLSLKCFRDFWERATKI